MCKIKKINDRNIDFQNYSYLIGTTVQVKLSKKTINTW